MAGFNPFDIYGSLLNLLWTVFVQGPLLIINAFNDVLYYLGGGVISDLMFGGAKSFAFDNVPKAFFIFLAISAIFFVLIYLVQLILIQFKKSTETKSKILKCLESSFMAWLFIFLIPIGFYLLNATVMLLSKALIGAFTQNSSLASYLYHVGDPTWDGTITNTPSSFSAPSNIKEWNIFSSIIGACFMLYICLMLGMLLIQKIIELFFLFVISPLIMTAMILDDGKAANLWKDMVIAKFLASTTSLTGFFVFIAALQAIANTGLSGLETNNFSRQFFFLIFTMGGGMATLYFTSMVGDFIGERVGVAEARQNFHSVMTASTAFAGIGGAVGGFLGLRKNKRTISGLGVTGSGGNLMNSTKEMMSQGIKPLPNALTKRSGIIGLTGLAIGGTATAVGATIAGTKKAWHAGDRTSVKGKIKGVVRVATIPVTSSAKSIGKGLNPKMLSTAQYAHSKSISKHNENIVKKRDMHASKHEKHLLNKNKINNMKDFVKSREKIIKSQNKSEKLNTQISKLNTKDKK